MPKPNKDEKREDFLHRFMASEEARRDYPKEDQRFAVAINLWEHRNTLEAANGLGYNAERDGAEHFRGRHLQPGLVGYPEMKHPISGKQGIDLLIEKDVVDHMRASAKGVPVVNWAHDMSGGAEKWIAEGKAVGVMTDSYWNGDAAYEDCGFMLWDKEAKANARNGFRLSNAWKEDEIDWTPGIHNGKPYDGRLVAAHYTHLAIVPNPRYEGAVIFANAQGGLKAMLKLFGIGKTEAVELSKDAAVEVGGKKYSALEVVNAMAALEKVSTTAKDGAIKDGDTVQIGDKKYTGLEIANALAAAEKAKTVEAKPDAKPEVKAAHETPEFQNAVDARVNEILEKKIGEGFFNGIAKLAQIRPGADAPKPANRMTEKERIAEGRKRFGGKTAAAQ